MEVAAKRDPAGFTPGLRGFFACCKALGYKLAPHQKTIARAFFGAEREIVACLARGQAKSTLAALLAVHHVLSHPDPSVYVGAGSREQARIIRRIVDRLARHPAVVDHLIVRHDELRVGEQTVLQIVASDGGRAYGWERPTLMIGDELWIWSDREPTLLGAMQTGLVKNRDARLFVISTAPSAPDTPLGRMRRRALEAPEVTRDGAFLDCRGDGLRWLEWSLPEDADPDDLDAVKAATPAPWISRDDLRQQRKRVQEVEWLQFHCNRSAVQSARWLPGGAWDACRADYDVGDEPQVLGIDIGGSRSASALIGVVADSDGVRVTLVEIRQGRSAVLEVSARVAELARQGKVATVVYDPMRFEGEALRLERDHDVALEEWPQSPTRMTRCSENLHRLVVEGRLRHPGHPELDRHVANAVAQPTPRGWRLVKSAEDAQIDGLIALAMAAEVAENRPEPPRFFGWIDRDGWHDASELDQQNENGGGDV